MILLPPFIQISYFYGQNCVNIIHADEFHKFYLLSNLRNSMCKIVAKIGEISGHQSTSPWQASLALGPAGPKLHLHTHKHISSSNPGQQPLHRCIP